MNDKYQSLQNTLDWIKNSSIEEFMETFNKLGDNYSGLTLGDILSDADLEEDEEHSDNFSMHIMSTPNFVYGLEIRSREDASNYISNVVCLKHRNLAEQDVSMYCMKQYDPLIECC